MPGGERPPPIPARPRHGRALFSPMAARRFRRALGAALLLPMLLIGGLMAWVRTPAATGEGRAPVQPVAFDHRIHAGALAIDCRYCHAEAARSATAGLPPSSACVACHQPALFASRMFDPVRTSLATGTPIVWRRVNRLPDFVYFDHAVHVGNGVGCETCHGRVDRMARVRQATPLTMAWCLDCHRAPESQLRPLDAITRMGFQPGDHPDSLPGVRHPVHCTACHR